MGFIHLKRIQIVGFVLLIGALVFIGKILRDLARGRIDFTNFLFTMGDTDEDTTEVYIKETPGRFYSILMMDAVKTVLLILAGIMMILQVNPLELFRSVLR